MTDYSWLEPIERRTREVEAETQRIREETQAWKAMWDNAERITLSQKDYDSLVKRLNNPPPPSPQFIAMLKKRPPWEDPAKQ